MADKIIHIPVGSGYLYHDVFSGKIPADADIEIEAHRIGYIEKGGEVDYKPTFKTFKDDFGIIQRSKLTAEEATFKASLIAWSASDFNTRLYLQPALLRRRGTALLKSAVWARTTARSIFFALCIRTRSTAHVRLTIVGTQTGGFKLNFKPDDAGNMDLEITAQASDSEGTLIVYDEEVLGDTVKASGLTVSSAAGSTSGKTKLTVTPTIGSGNSYLYMTGAQTPAVGAVLSAWTAWDGTADITAATGDILTVAEVDSAGKAVKAGICTVTAKV
jgi:hypothetical protein